MKKIISLILVSIMAISLFAACGESSSQNTAAKSEASTEAKSEATAAKSEAKTEEKSEAAAPAATEEKSEAAPVAEPDKTYVVGASFSQTNITPFGNHLYLDLVDLCEQKGWELISMDCERDATKEAANMEALLLQELDILFYWPYDKEAAVNNAKKASEEGIPVVTVNADIAEEGWDYTVAYVGPDQYNMAKDIAQYIVDGLDEKGKVAVIDGTAGTTQYVLRMEGFEEVMNEYPDMEIIAHDYSNGDRNEAITLMENYLTTYGDELKAVYVAAGDNCAIGVAQVLEEQNRTDIILISNDGMAEALELIKAGSIDATMMQKPLYQIERFGEIAELVFAGKADEITEHKQFSRYQLVTIDNVDDEPAEY